MLTWLPASGVVQITEATVLVGHGGWGDSRAADFLKSDVILNDYLLVEELRKAMSTRSQKTMTTRSGKATITRSGKIMKNESCNTDYRRRARSAI